MTACLPALAPTLSLAAAAATNSLSRDVLAGSAPHDVISGFSVNDSVVLAGFGGGEAVSDLANAVSAAGDTTIALSDNTQISFLGIASASALQLHVYST